MAKSNEERHANLPEGEVSEESTHIPNDEANSTAAKITDKAAMQELFHKLRGVTQGKPHAFWNTQPVPQLEDEDSANVKCGPIKQCTMEDVNRTPVPLPAQFKWVQVNITEAAQLTEVYELLRDNYVEDDDNMFRFEYSRDFLKWAMCPPNYRADWHIGVRTDSGRLVAFISAILLNMVLHDNAAIPMAEVNFLCVHKKLRTKRLAPVLIKEITRRVNLRGIWQAVYTAGTLLTKPAAVCSYWHRPIHIEKLVEVRFTGLRPKTTMAMAKRLYRIPETFTVSRIRVARKADMPRILELLMDEFKKTRKMYPTLQLEDLKHLLTPRTGVVWTYVRENAEKVVTDFFSFYALPSTVVNHPTHEVVNAAYSFYSAATTLTTAELVTQSIVAARDAKFDVYNTLDLGDLGSIVTDLKFGRGDGCLRYYFYNYMCPPLEPRDVGLVML